MIVDQAARRFRFGIGEIAGLLAFVSQFVRRLDNECAAILKLLADEEDQHFEIGVHYNRIVDGKLYKDGGFKSAAELVSRRLGGIFHATLTTYGAIAKAFDEEFATKYGSAVLGELLVYEKATGGKLPSGDPAQVPIKVPHGGSTKEKPFADCSLSELRAAVHKLRVPHWADRAWTRRYHPRRREHKGVVRGAGATSIASRPFSGLGPVRAQPALETARRITDSATTTAARAHRCLTLSEVRMMVS